MIICAFSFAFYYIRNFEYIFTFLIEILLPQKGGLKKQTTTNDDNSYFSLLYNMSNESTYTSELDTTIISRHELPFLFQWQHNVAASVCVWFACTSNSMVIAILWVYASDLVVIAAWSIHCSQSTITSNTCTCRYRDHSVLIAKQLPMGTLHVQLQMP